MSMACHREVDVGHVGPAWVSSSDAKCASQSLAVAAPTCCPGRRRASQQLGLLTFTRCRPAQSPLGMGDRG